MNRDKLDIAVRQEPREASLATDATGRRSEVIVLVHGAWHGAWCYADVIRLLRAQGHDVFATTLTGLGERSHLQAMPINLSTHVEDVVNLCRSEDLEDIVLVGHSYGGMVVTGVADRIPDRIRRIVYLDAFVPADGDSLMSLLGEDALAGLLATLEPDGLFVRPIPAVVWGVTEEKQAWVDAKCVNQPVATFLEPIKLKGTFRDKPRRYVYATGYGAPLGQTSFTRFYEAFRTDPGWDVRTIASGHDLMVDHPQETARLIIA